MKVEKKLDEDEDEDEEEDEEDEEEEEVEEDAEGSFKEDEEPSFPSKGLLMIVALCFPFPHLLMYTIEIEIPSVSIEAPRVCPGISCIEN